MSESQRKPPAGKQPISRHPLFPATVALWFGALFGLGSMAMRPALIEQIVLATGLEAIIPAAQPPLGATTQILLALTAAGVGGLLGALLARRIARPLSATPERRRSATRMADPRGFAQLATSEDDEDPRDGAPVPRRRPLSTQNDPSPREFAERAPLPGGSPQILNVSEFDLGGFEAEEAEPIQEFVAEADDFADPEGELAAFDSSAEAWPADQRHPGDPGDRQSFVIEDDGIHEPESQSVMPANPDAHAPEGEYVDTVERPSFREPRSAETRGDSFDEPGRIAGTTDTRPFGAPGIGEEVVDAGATGELSEEPCACEGRADESPVSFAQPAGARPIADAPSRNASPMDVGGDPREEGPAAAKRPMRILSAGLNELSHAELLERLALNLERSRSRQAAAFAPVGGQPGQHDEKAAAAPRLAADAMADEAQEHLPAPSSAGDLAREDKDAIAASAVRHQDESDEEAAGQFAAPPPVTIPAALRPIDLDEDSDSELLPAFVPPRHISFTGATDGSALRAEDEQVVPADPAVGEAASQEPPGAHEHEDSSDADRELEAGYSSLLSLSRRDRQQFVRIEEPEAEHAETKPFVVFPHEEASSPAPFARPASDRGPDPQAVRDEGESPPVSEKDERRFDQPDGGNSAARDGAAPTQKMDAEETERSLRAALATLQRMSGAA